MNNLYGFISILFILVLGSESSLAAVDLNKDTQLVKTANTQFSSNATLEQVFADYRLFKNVEWRATPTPDGRNSTVQVIGTYDLDKFVGLQDKESLPKAVEKTTVDAFKAEYSSIQYIINFSLVHMAAGTAVKVESTSFHLVSNGISYFFPDTELLGFRDITRNKPPYFILSSLVEMRPGKSNAAKKASQVTIK